MLDRRYGELVDVSERVVGILTTRRGREAVSSGDVGKILAAVRRGLGLRQVDLAARSGYSQATISRLETGRLRDRVVASDVAEALEIPDDVFRGLTGRPITGSRVDDVERRDMLKATLAVASAAILPAAVAEADTGGRIGVAAVKDCWRALERLHRLEYTRGGAAVYELTAGMARQLQSAIGSATYSAAVGRRLRQVTAATMIQAGWQAYDARRPDVARDWWLETLHLGDLGDGVDEYRVSALASLAREATDGVRRGNDAVELSRAAARDKGTTEAMLSLLAAREALGHAALGDRTAASAAMRRAHRHLDRSDGEDNPVWMRFWGPSDLAIHEMHAARLAGDHAAAEQAAREAVIECDPHSMARDHAIYTSCLGSSLARVGKFDEAVSVSRDVLVSTAKSGSYRVRAELRDTARLLSRAPYPEGRAFAATVDRLVPAP